MKRMKLYMDRKKLYIILCIILVCVFSLTLAYAALSVTLNINGNAEVIGSNWDIKFKNPVVKVGSVTSTAPRIVSLNEVEFSTTLNMPGDFYEFTIDIANDGTIDAMIENIRVVSNITENDLKYINALIEYDNGVQVTNKQLLKADSFVRLKCRIEYRKDITASDLPSTSTSLDFTMHFVYSQADDTAFEAGSSSGNQKKVNIISGDLDTIGSEVCIDTECFYVLGSQDDYVMLLTKYNLYVGYVLTDMVGTDETPIYEKISGETGIQNYLARGLVTENGRYKFPMYGGYQFSNNNNSIYNSSDIKLVVDNYGDYLSGLGYTPIQAALMNVSFLDSLGCDIENRTCLTSDYDWLYSTSYWTSLAYDDSSVYVVASTGYILDVNCYVRYAWGVRPTLLFNKSNLLG